MTTFTESMASCMIPLGNLLGGVVSNHIQSIDISIGIRNGVAAIFDMLFFCKEVVKMNLLLPQNPRKIGVAAFIEKLFPVSCEENRLLCRICGCQLLVQSLPKRLHQQLAWISDFPAGPVAKYAHEKTTSTIPKRTWLMWFFALELNYDEKL